MTSAAAMAIEPITVDGQQCRDWSASSQLEWLETNGCGGFAMGTVSGANTRRYHGVLIASLKPPVERHVLLSRLEEELLCEGDSCNLGAAQYPGVVTPAGFRHLEHFRLDPFPVWTYSTGCAQVEKKLFLLHGRQTVVVQYRVSRRCRLRVRPFLAFRDYHSLQHASDAFRTTVHHDSQSIRMQPFDGMPALHIQHNADGFVPVGHWYLRNEYRTEMERGLDFQEDLYSPGWMDFELEAGQWAFVVAGTEEIPAIDAAQIGSWEMAERERRAAIPSDFTDSLRERLEMAAEQFLVCRADGSPTIIAGYPWFTDWGRDTMISIPGLLIARGKAAIAQQMLAGFLEHMDQGIIPNRFPDGNERPEYNTADATLWAFIAAWSLPDTAAASGFVREQFYPAAKEIIRWHERGTHFGIHVDAEDGLLHAGMEGSQLTWMDAKCGDWVVTPRHGKPVEINALWYNALRMMAWWAARFGETEQADEFTSKADRVLRSFETEFWNPQRGCLYDRIATEGADTRVRPNQIFALSLPFPLMNERQQRSVLQVVEETLLTPFGLRTLEPGDPEYRPRYEGGPLERDGAYHQGTIWPWLLGPYISAKLQVEGYTPAVVNQCRLLMEGFAGEIRRGCLGSIAEIYEAEPPHRQVGAPAQAWSVAELLRVMSQLSSYQKPTIRNLPSDM